MLMKLHMLKTHAFVLFLLIWFSVPSISFAQDSSPYPTPTIFTTILRCAAGTCCNTAVDWCEVIVSASDKPVEELAPYVCSQYCEAKFPGSDFRSVIKRNGCKRVCKARIQEEEGDLCSNLGTFIRETCGLPTPQTSPTY